MGVSSQGRSASSLLAANGQGKKKLQYFEQSDASDMHDAILEAFPKLSSAGGYDLLRTIYRKQQMSDRDYSTSQKLLQSLPEECLGVGLSDQVARTAP